MTEIGIYLVVNDLYYQTKYCIENLTSKTERNIRLHILDNGSQDERVINYLKEISKNNTCFVKRLDYPVSLSEAYNTIIQYSYQELFCLFPVNVLVNEFWCEELISEYTQAENPGIIGIRNGFESLKLSTIIYKSNDPEGYLKNVWISENNNVDGLMFMSREKFNKIGNFNTKLDAPGYESAELCFRFLAHGMTNFYIQKHTCSRANLDNTYLFPTKTYDGAKKLKQQIEVISKTNYSIV